MSTKILIIDDDKQLCEGLTTYFEKFDLSLISANTPSEGLARLESEKPEVLLLDVMMPEVDGFTLCKSIRAESSIPIIMLTARGELTDKVVGLELGADDYLSKPFEPRELVARVQVLARRSAPPVEKDEVMRFADLEIWVQRHQVFLGGKELSLTGMEFNLLTLLARHPGQVFTRDEILSALKGIDSELYSRSIDILMSRLRHKLGDDPKQVRFIKTLRSLGYTFVARTL
ncbi:response regulator transcription factor [Lacimicrobium sp. SS2-24]|uniref:response regulator transcription factor n=1 Tax=Lacimicrobium sp. SS2-24 TaxID=2005569 RepID=UPI000B4AD86A|nr:response regulator transcription factor [Lacimicrobium sp. SS2-24]